MPKDSSGPRGCSFFTVENADGVTELLRCAIKKIYDEGEPPDSTMDKRLTRDRTLLVINLKQTLLALLAERDSWADVHVESLIRFLRYTKLAKCVNPYYRGRHQDRVSLWQIMPHDLVTSLLASEDAAAAKFWLIQLRDDLACVRKREKGRLTAECSCAA